MKNLESLPKLKNTCLNIHCEYLITKRVGDSWDRGEEFSCGLTKEIIDGYCDFGELKVSIPEWCPRRKV